jgi:hypothetical protein
MSGCQLLSRNTTRDPRFPGWNSWPFACRGDNRGRNGGCRGGFMQNLTEAA